MCQMSAILLVQTWMYAIICMFLLDEMEGPLITRRYVGWHFFEKVISRSHSILCLSHSTNVALPRSQYGDIYFHRK